MSPMGGTCSPRLERLVSLEDRDKVRIGWSSRSGGGCLLLMEHPSRRPVVVAMVGAESWRLDGQACSGIFFLRGPTTMLRSGCCEGYLRGCSSGGWKSCSYPGRVSCLVALLFSSFVCEKEKEEKRGKKREKGGGAEIEKERKAWKALKVC